MLLICQDRQIPQRSWRKLRSNFELAAVKHTAAVRTKRGSFFRWRCAQGRHPFSSRTRWLRPGRPMILYWRRYGKAGGCRIKWGLSSVGRAPALQAGGREFESLSLHSAEKTAGSRTLKTEYREESIKPRRNRKMQKHQKYSFEKERHLKQRNKKASLMPR